MLPLPLPIYLAISAAAASTVVLLDLPPGPQFSAGQKQQQIALGVGLPSRIVAAHAAGASAFRVPAGDYRWAAPTTGADVWPLVLDSLHRTVGSLFTIEADGATFWFETRGGGFEPAPHVTRGLRVVNCSHLKIKGLTTDFDPPNTIEGRVTNIDRPGNRLQVELSAGSLFRPSPPTMSAKPNVGRFIPYKSSGEFITPLYRFQNSRGLRFVSWTALDRTGRFWATLENSLLLNQTAAPGWRKAFGSAGTLEEGDAIAIMYAVGSAIEILQSEAVTLSSCKNFAAKTGFAETLGKGGHRFDGLVFGKRPNTNRLMGGEGVMSNACRRGSQWRNVSISLTTDDLFNFHGYWGYVDGVIGPNLVAFRFDCLRPGCFTARSTGAVLVGDRVNWRRNTTMALVGSGVVVEVINASLLRFSNDVSALGAHLVAEFPDTANQGWSIRDSIFFDAYQRLFVQSGPGEVVNNTFVRVGSSISIRSTVLSLNEGGDPSGILIANNTLINVSLSPGGGGVSSSPITIGRLGESPVVDYSAIVISGNTMSLAGGAAVFAESVANLTIADNDFTSPCVISADVDPDGGATARQAVFLSHAVGVRVNNNTLVDASGSCKQDPATRSALLGLGKGTSGVVLDGVALPPTLQTPSPGHNSSYQSEKERLPY